MARQSQQLLLKQGYPPAAGPACFPVRCCCLWCEASESRSPVAGTALCVGRWPVSKTRCTGSCLQAGRQDHTQQQQGPAAWVRRPSQSLAVGCCANSCLLHAAGELLPGVQTQHGTCIGRTRGCCCKASAHSPKFSPKLTCDSSRMVMGSTTTPVTSTKGVS